MGTDSSYEFWQVVHLYNLLVLNNNIFRYQYKEHTKIFISV